VYKWPVNKTRKKLGYFRDCKLAGKIIMPFKTAAKPVNRLRD